MKGSAMMVALSLLLSSDVSFALQDTYPAAYDRGYADGAAAGRLDRETRRAFDFANEPQYQDALGGFRPGLHDRDVYTVAYRRGFEDGYESGYGLSDEAGLPGDAASDSSLSEPLERLSGRVTLPAGTELHVRLLESISTQGNERGDEVRAEIVEDVQVNGATLIEAGSEVLGEITHLKRPGRIKGRAEMNLVFDELELESGNRVAMTAVLAGLEERVEKEVDSEGTIEGSRNTGRDLGTVGGGATIGALIGVLAGGGEGMKTGAGVGAVAGVAGVLMTRGGDIMLPAETEMKIRLDRDLVITTGVLRLGPQTP